MTTATKPNTGFWIIAIIGLLWNLIGIFFWATEYFLMTDEMKAMLPPEQIELMNNAPSWGMWVYAFAVFSATLASLLMVMKKKLCVPIFLLSLISIIFMQGYWIFIMDTVGTLGAGAIVMPLIVIAIAVFLYFYSKGAAAKTWLS